MDIFLYKCITSLQQVFINSTEPHGALLSWIYAIHLGLEGE